MLVVKKVHDDSCEWQWDILIEGIPIGTVFEYDTYGCEVCSEILDIQIGDLYEGCGNKAGDIQDVKELIIESLNLNAEAYVHLAKLIDSGKIECIINDGE